MRNGNELEFKNAIISLLEKIKTNEETYTEVKKGFDLFTETGFERFEIAKNSYIEIKFVLDSNFETFRHVYMQCASMITKDVANIVLICNLSSNLVDKFAQKLEHQKRIKIISIDDLYNIEFDVSPNGSDNSKPKMFTRLKKAISFEYFNDFLMYLIRVNILVDAFPSGKVSMTQMMAQKNDIFPFAYHDQSNNWHIFIREKSRYTKNSILFQENATVHKVGVNTKNNQTFLTIDGKETPFTKISRTWFGHHIAFFNSGFIFDMIPQNKQYKYRKFGKSSLDEFNDTAISEFTKKVIEDNEIYFSTKEQLNDPFDLDADGYSSITHLTSSNYRIFCTSGKNDNILLWSHYGDSHFGYCTSYLPIEILDAVEKDTNVVFCVYGDVNYKKTRKVSKSDLSYLPIYYDDEMIALTLQIEQLFRKYEDWHYEGEFRYIVSVDKPIIGISGNSKVSKETGLSFKVEPKDYYFGYNFDFNSKTKAYLASHIGKQCYSFDLSKTEYELLIKTVSLI